MRIENCLLKHIFFSQAGSESISISFNKQVVGIKPNENSIEVETKKGERESFDFVVSTIPIPQLLQFKNADNFISGILHYHQYIYNKNNFIIIMSFFFSKL